MAKAPAKLNKPLNNRIIGSGVERVDQMLANPANFRIHPDNQQQALAGSIDDIGFIRSVTVNKRTGRVIDGHLRVILAARSGVEEIPVEYVDLDEDEEAQALLSLDPIAAMAASDKQNLDELLHQVQSDDERVQEMCAEIAEKEGLEYYEEKPLADELEDSAENFLERQDVPDAVWATDNEWGIPLLDINLQATSLDLPFVTWGTTSRKARMSGTWHFYTEDYRYNKLWSDPSDIINSKCVNIVEPNYSIYNQMPPAVALWAIYRKRWIARWAQSYGIKIFSDLNVAEHAYKINLLGIPRGWKAWCTRGYSERLSSTEKEYQIAVEHAGTSSILFVVYGGGKLVKEMCQSNGWIWFDEQENNKAVKNG